MKRSSSPRSKRFPAGVLRATLVSLFALGATFGGLCAAPAPPTGAIAGRVLQPASGEFLRNAQIRHEESGQTVTSDNEGRYRFAAVAAGPATLVATYTGFQTVRATLEVKAGMTVQRDFDLVSALQPGAGDGAAVALGAFIVSGERAGNAKAIMDQRQSMNITNSVASDVFGDDTEGNVGEFLKHLPGVEVELSFGEVRNVRLRGLGSDYTSVTLDGVTLANTDPSTVGGDGSRAFTFESFSLSSVDSIEVSKTVSADVDANAPAGTINLRSKRAFERTGRRVVLQANAAAHSEEFHLRKTQGPGDGFHRKIRPGGMVEYSDVFLNRRLGVVLNLSESNLYQEVLATSLTYNRATTAADQRPAVITALQFLHSPRFNERFSTTLTTDFKATPNLVLSLGLIYNWSDLFMAQQAVIFNSGARTAVGGADPLVAYTSAPAGTVAVGPQRIAKAGQILTVLPKFEYRLGELLFEGRFSDSIARAWYDPLTKHSSIRSMVNPTASNVAFRAERTDAMSTDWRVTQTAGPDLGNGALFTSPEANINDGRRSRTEVYSGELVATLRTRRFAPVTWKAGLKSRRDVFDFRSELGAIRYNYVGPGGGATGGWAAFASPLVPDPGAAGGSITTLSGRPVFMPDMRRIGQTFRERPEYFLLNVPANTYFNARVANTRHYEEQIDAAFLMGTAALGRATVRAGLRREETSNASLEFDPRSNAEVRAAGFPVNTRATTIPGIDYQFLSRPRIKREGGYDNLFPSASFKYDFTPQLNFHAGYSSTIRRPTVSDVAGVWLVNDLTSRATVPNAQLRPETSDNTSVRLAYYFEPVGIVGVSVYQNSVRDLHRTNELSAEQFGNTDPDLDSYRFITTSNTPGLVRIRGLELEYSQSLSFLPRPLRGLSIRGSYTRNYAEIIVPRMAPHTASAGLACNWRRASLTLNGRWSDDVPTNDTGTEYIRHRTSLDLNGAFHLNARYSLSFSARNLTNAPQFDMTKPGPGPALWDRHQIYGTTWTFSVKGVF